MNKITLGLAIVFMLTFTGLAIAPIFAQAGPCTNPNPNPN